MSRVFTKFGQNFEIVGFWGQLLLRIQFWKWEQIQTGMWVCRAEKAKDRKP